MLIAYRQDQMAANSKLIHERLWYRRRSRCHNDRAERRKLTPPERTIEASDNRIRDLQFAQNTLCVLRKLGQPLNCKDLSGNLREDCCLIPGACANLEHAVTARQFEKFRFACHDVRL